MTGHANGNPIALVTGAGVRIGRQIAERLAREGYGVAVHVRSRNPQAIEVVEHIRALGRDATLIEGDLEDDDAAATIMERASIALGHITLLVNNASKFEPDDVQQLNRKQWDAHFAINLRTPAFLMQEMACRLPDTLSGSIINIIDQRVWKLTPQFVSYTLTKSALWSATRTFAQALAPRIRVNAIGPGPTLPSARQTTDQFSEQSKSVLLGSGASLSEIADAVVYLAQAESVTGQMIAVDGGQHLVWQTPDVCSALE